MQDSMLLSSSVLVGKCSRHVHSRVLQNRFPSSVHIVHLHGDENIFDQGTLGHMERKWSVTLMGASLV